MTIRSVSSRNLSLTTVSPFDVSDDASSGSVRSVEGDSEASIECASILGNSRPVDGLMTLAEGCMSFVELIETDEASILTLSAKWLLSSSRDLITAAGAGVVV